MIKTQQTGCIKSRAQGLEVALTNATARVSGPAVQALVMDAKN